MKRFLSTISLLLIAHFNTAVYAATDIVYIDQASEIARDLEMPLNEKKPILPQVLEMREELRNRVFDISRMTSPHSFRCKRARRQLMEVNSLVRKLRDSDE